MKRAMAVACLALSLAPASLIAGETAKTPVTGTSPAPEAAAAGQVSNDQESPAPPTTEEVSGKVDALTEAFTEMKNTVDALNRMKLSGYIQPQYVHDESSLNSLSSATATRNKDQFAVRRARVKFQYQFSPTSRFVFQPEIASGGVTLKDGYVEYIEPYTDWHHTLTAGQFNWPFGFEVGYSSSDREVPERSRVVRTLFPGERDRGVQLSGLGLVDRFSYKVAIVNGTGTTQTFDFNKRKDIVGRVGGNFGPLDLGVSIYRGSDLVSVVGAVTGQEFPKRREGVDFQLVTPIPGLGIRGEFIRGKQAPGANAAAIAALSADVQGYYVYLIENAGVRNQFVVRYDTYNPDRNKKLPNVVGNAKVDTLTGSYIFHWDANSKVMFAYDKIKTRDFVDPKDNVFTLRYQYKF